MLRTRKWAFFTRGLEGLDEVTNAVQCADGIKSSVARADDAFVAPRVRKSVKQLPSAAAR